MMEQVDQCSAFEVSEGEGRSLKMTYLGTTLQAKALGKNKIRNVSRNVDSSVTMCRIRVWFASAGHNLSTQSSPMLISWGLSTKTLNIREQCSLRH